MEQLLHDLNQYWQPVIDYFAFDVALLSEPSMIIRLVIMLCLLLCSAFFSSSETALFSLSRLDLQQLRKEQNSRSETIHELLDQPRKLIISILCGTVLYCNMVLTLQFTVMLEQPLNLSIYPHRTALQHRTVLIHHRPSTCRLVVQCSAVQCTYTGTWLASCRASFSAACASRRRFSALAR